MKKETVLITGANSFIAQKLITLLDDNYDLKFLTRTPKKPNEYFWNVTEKILDEKALDDVLYIVHLAGSKLNDGTPLTPERKELVYDSRIGAADLLRNKLKDRNQKIKSFISASAIGYYGFNDTTLEIDENGLKGYGFAADLSEDWEKAADKFKTDQIAENVAKIRVSLVLGLNGGVFPIYKNIVENNPNVIHQPNNASVPWNHIDDMAGIFAFAITHNLDGVYNSVAPEPASQQDIFKTIFNRLNINNQQEIKPFKGQHLISKKIQNLGYQFKFNNIQQAVNDLIKQQQ